MGDEQVLLPGSKGSIWRTWMVTCQARYGYFLFLVLMFIVVFSMAISVSVFFLTFVPSTKSDGGSISSGDGPSMRFGVGVACFPLMLFVTAWMFDQVLEMWMDTMRLEGGGMASFRHSLTVVIHSIRHWRWLLGRDGGRTYGGHGYQTFGEDVDIVATGGTDDDGNIQDGSSNARPASYPGVGEVLLIETPKHRDEYTGPWPIDPATHRIVDLVVPVIFDLVVLVAMIISIIATGGSFQDGLLTFVEAGFLTALVYCVAWVILEITVQSVPKMWPLYRLLEERQEIMEQKVNKLRLREDAVIMGYRLFTSIGNQSCRDNAERLCPDDENLAIADEADEDKDWLHEIYNGYPLYSLAFFVLAYMIACAVAYVNVFIGYYLVMLAIWFLSGFIKRVSRNLLSGAFRGFLGFFIIFTALSFTAVQTSGDTNTDYRSDLGVVPPAKQTDQFLSLPAIGNPFFSGTHSYEVCSYDFNGLTIVDLVMLCDAAYSTENVTNLEISLSTLFTNTMLGDYEIVAAKSDDWVVFNEVYFPKINSTVISVRGTTTAIDALKDLQYWFAVGFLQTISKSLIPLMHQLPELFVSNMLYLAALPGIGPDPVYEVLVDYVQERKDALCTDPTTDCPLLLTGHSLGGGMAAIAGTRTGVNVVSISGPGVKASRERFHVDEGDIADYVVTVKPDNDLVPQVDVLAGMVQEISCPSISPLPCHMTATTLCTLYCSCGDLRNRDWSASPCECD